MKVACFTSASYSYLDRARVLFETVREFHPDWENWLCLVDEDPQGFELYLDREDFDHVRKARDLGIVDFEAWAFEHEVVELCTAVKGPMLCQLLEQGYDKVIYLDPDTALFGRLDEVLELLDLHGVVLTPHQIDPDTTRSAIVDNEIGSLKFGIFNLGFVAVQRSDTGTAFARWWRDRLLQFCYDDVPSGLFTDQKWCNHAPVFFPDLAILRHRGYNVASWNLSQRPLRIGIDGNITAGGDPLKFFHFTKVTHVGETMLTRYSNGRNEVFELMHWYKHRLAKHEVRDIPKDWWYFGSYANGTQISREERIAHRQRRLQGTHRANPFVQNEVHASGDRLRNSDAQVTSELDQIVHPLARIEEGPLTSINMWWQHHVLLMLASWRGVFPQRMRDRFRRSAAKRGPRRKLPLKQDGA